MSTPSPTDRSELPTHPELVAAGSATGAGAVVAAAGSARAARRKPLLGLAALGLVLGLATACGPEPAPEPPAEPVAAPEPESAPEVAANPRVAELTELARPYLERMVAQIGIRVTGTAEEQAAARWLAEEMRAAGVEVAEQRFPLPVLDGAVVIHGEREVAMPGLVQFGSSRATVTGTLVDGGSGSPEDLDGMELAGEIVMLRRGEAALAERAARAVREGAAALIVYNEVPSLFQDDLRGSIEVPVVGITKPRGDQLRELLGRGEVELTIQADQHSQNVVGSSGAGADGGERPIVVLGAHYDSVAMSPGANDNATGTAVLLAVAHEIASRSLPYELRLVAFGAEERQLIGSTHYVDELPQEERDRIVLMLNFDSIGKGPLGVDGTDGVVEDSLAVATRQGIELVPRQPRAGTRSDHAPFAEIGVPHAYFFGTVLTRIHSPEDTLDDIEPLRLGEATAIALELLAELEEEPGLGEATTTGADGPPGARPDASPAPPG